MDRHPSRFYDQRRSVARKGKPLRKFLAEAWASFRLGPILAVAAVYSISGRLGLELAIPPGYASAIWPPSGIALAAVLLRGNSIWPGILLGSYCVNVGNGFDASSSHLLALSLGLPLVIALGASLQALAGAALVRHSGADFRALAEGGDVIRLFSLGGIVASAINSSLAVSALYLAGRVPAGAVLGNLTTWWTGDAIGVFVFAPLTIAWAARSSPAWTERWRPLVVSLGIGFVLTVLLVAAITTTERTKLAEDFTEHSGRLAADIERTFPAPGRSPDQVAAAALRDGARNGINVWLIEEGLGGDVVLAANTSAAPAPFMVAERGLFGGRMEMAARLPLPSSGRQWQLRTAPTQEFFARHRLAGAWPALVGGFVFTCLLGAFAMVVTGREVALRRLVDQRTAMLVASEARLREYSEAVADWFWESDQDHRLIFLSDSFETILNRSPGEILGKRSWEVASDTMEVAPGEWRTHITDLTARRPFRDFKYWISDRDGRPKWVKISGIPRYDPGGEFIGYLGTGTDVTGAVANAHHMHLLNRAIEQSPVSVMITDLEPRIEYVNAKFLATSGYEIGDVVGKTPRELRSMTAQPNIFEEIQGTLREGRDWRGELVNYRADGSQYWELATVQPIQNPEGQVTNYLVTKTDITERKQTEARMAELMGELRRSNQELEQFAYVASHDLRQPLRMISSYVSLLDRRLMGRLDEDEMEFIAFARDGANRMDRLILDLLDYSRAGRDTDKFEPVPLADVFADALQNLEPAIEESEAEIKLPDSLPEISGNYSELVRLFQNLIGNAIKYRAADIRPLIRVSCRSDDRSWVVSVEDNGIGIAADQLDRIFGIFQRLHTRDRYEGTGIGLAVCRKVAESHGGHIRVKSEVGVGSVFSVVLPHRDDQSAYGLNQRPG